MALSSEPYKGVRDFYPEDWGRLGTLFTRLRAVLSLHGYEEYQASPLEHSELYESKGNEEIIREQAFSFEDRGGRRVTLRPEMTPTLARLVAQKRRELAFPLRWFSIGNRSRYERPQRGRLREFFQCDVDLVGLPAGKADLEVITLAYTLLTSFGATNEDFRIRINSRPLLSAACSASGLGNDEGAREFWRLLDRKDKMSAEEFEKELDGKPDPLKEIENATDAAVKAEKDKLFALIDAPKARGIENVTFDPSIVRGFDYYTGVVFELFDTDPVNSRSLFGGGRYDGLVSLFGGDPLPAVGFAIGDVTLLDFLETHNLLPDTTSAPQVYIGTPESSDAASAEELAEELREAGIRVLVNLTEKALGDQVKDAVKRGIPYFVAYGEQEAKSNMLRVKHLAKSEEETVELNQIAKYFKGLLG